MSEPRKVSMKLNAAGRGDIEVDGHRIPHLSGFKVDASAGELMRVELEFAFIHMDLDAPAMVHLAPDTAEALTRLGWTPPAE